MGLYISFGFIISHCTLKIQNYLNDKNIYMIMELNNFPEKHENKKLIGLTESGYLVYGTRNRVALYKEDKGPSNPMAVFPNNNIKSNLEDTQRFHGIKKLSDFGEELVDDFDANLSKPKITEI